MKTLPKIFVSIASYRDPQCQYTVKDLFEKASHPERIFVGLCTQLDPDEDNDCITIPSPFPNQVREKRYHARDSKGGCWARAEALSLLEDEDYVMQLDAHMRFVQGWDTLMIDMLKQCASDRPVLSTMPPDFNPPNQFQNCEGGLPVTYVSALGNAGDLQQIHLGGWLRVFDRIPDHGNKPFPGAFIIGNFHIAPVQAFKEVPFDPHIYFRGQEPVFSARLWTHGWDIFQPNKLVIYHYWGSQSRGNYKNRHTAADLGLMRVQHLLGMMEATDIAALVEIEKYGMGRKRTLDDYWEFSGVDLKNRVLSDKAAKGFWTEYK